MSKRARKDVESSEWDVSTVYFYIRFLFCFYKSLMSNNSKEFRHGPTMLALAPSLSTLTGVCDRRVQG